eukprot:scaffold488_cov109-Skeletonema_dohrnii-CCMP3373.AAC.9
MVAMVAPTTPPTRIIHQQPPAQPRTGWVSQLASRQNMIGADSYARIVSAARVKMRAKSFS